MRTTREIETSTFNGWMMLVIILAVAAALIWYGVHVIQDLVHTVNNGQPLGSLIWQLVGTGVALAICIFCMFGFFTVQPNQVAVLILFGKYKGTEQTDGFHWANPLLSKKKVSFRAHNLNGEIIKVNDLRGNPIEIAVVVVWQVTDSAQAVFDVEDYESYVRVQSEAALRHLAMSYSYDTYEDDALSLRGSVDEVSHTLQKEVQDRVARAGVHIEEARISHLAYAPEIAGAMLQRQQAEAVVAARSRIVDGAVGMVEMALEKLEQHNTIQLDEERKAAMVSNLLVVLCGDKAAHPVVNAGTLYS